MYAVAVTPDGQHIISGSWDEPVKVWSVATKSLVSNTGHTDFVLAVATMPDGQRFLSGGLDNTVRVWLLNGTLENTFELHTDQVNAVALPDNQHALSGSHDTTVKLFNVNDGNWHAHLHAPRQSGALPGAAARRPPLRERLDRQTARVAHHGLAP